MINNSVPCTKNVSNVFSERKDIELTSKTPAHLNPVGEYYEHILNANLICGLIGSFFEGENISKYISNSSLLSNNLSIFVKVFNKVVA